MTEQPAAVESAAIVIVGPLSPMLFQPHWLAAQDLITKHEADTVQDLVITSEISQVRTEWLLLNCADSKLRLTTSLQPYFGVLRDMASKLLEILEPIPIAAVGLNRVAHFDLGSDEKWHDVGHTLAPKPGIWDDILISPGTRRVAIQGLREGKPGNVNVVVEPSAAIEHGLFIEINDHFEGPEWPTPTVGWAREILSEEWSSHEENVRRIFHRLTSIASQSERKD